MRALVAPRRGAARKVSQVFGRFIAVSLARQLSLGAARSTSWPVAPFHKSKQGEENGYTFEGILYNF